MFDTILLFLFVAMVCMVGGMVLFAKVAASNGLAGKAASGVAKIALGRALKGLGR